MIDPIVWVSNLTRAVTYYTEVLGFDAADWSTEDFTSVSFGGHGIYLAQQQQGQAGSWLWIGVGDVRALHEFFAARAATIRLPPTSYPWALELHVEDPDGNVLRFGSDPDD